MEQTNAEFKCNTMVFSDTKEQSLECDMLLPDYYPEVDKVLQSTMELGEESVTLNADKIGIAGKACFTLVFLSAEKKIYSFSVTEKYTKLIPCGETQNGDACIVRQSQTSLNFRVAAPRRIELRAVAAVHAQLYRLTQTAALSGLSSAGVETLTAGSPCFIPHVLQEVSLDLVKNVKLPLAREKISAVLHKRVCVHTTELKTVANKLMLNGELEISLTLAADDGHVYSDLQFHLPFSEVKEMFGAEENDVCYFCQEHGSVEVNLKTSQGEADACELRIRCGCLLLAGKQETVSYLKDAYSLHGSLHVTAAPVQMDCAVTPVQTRFPFSAQAEYYDDTATEICAAFISDIRFSCAEEKEKTEISGSATVNALLKNNSGGYSFVSRSATFTFEKAETQGQRQRFYQVECQSVSAAFAGSGLLRFSGEFSLNGFEIIKSTEEMLTSAALPEQTDARIGHEKIVVYYGERGETLWNIAKENHAAVSQIAAQNDLKENVLSENAVLVFPAY